MAENARSYVDRHAEAFRIDSAGRLMNTASVLKAWCQLQLARFQWLNGQNLASHPYPRKVLTPTCGSVVQSIFAGAKALAALQEQIRNAHQQ